MGKKININISGSMIDMEETILNIFEAYKKTKLGDVPSAESPEQKEPASIAAMRRIS